jgi:ABC-2 type transport system permease protein
MIAAILRAQVLSMRWGRGRHSFLRVLPTVVWYGFWIFAAVFVCQLARGQSVGSLRAYLPLGFLAVFLYWQFMPVLSASMGAGLDMRKLLAYPVPHEKLFTVEVMLRLTTAAEMLLVLGGGSIGMLINPRAGVPAARVLAAAFIFILFNLLLASGTRSLLERLLTRRKVREVVILLTMCLWMAPRLIMQLHWRPKWLGPAAEALRGTLLPWSATATAIAGESAAIPFAVLGCWTLAALWFGRTQFERNLRYDAAAAQAHALRSDAQRSRSLAELFFRLPGSIWRDPLAAIVEKELRSLARTPRFRTVFVMGFTFGILVWLPMGWGRGEHPDVMSPYFLVFVCLYALTLIGQVTYWNCFGFDRSATMFYFAAPQPVARVLIGKNIASLIYIYFDISILAAIVGALRMIAGFGQVLETAIVVGISSAYLLAFGNMASVNYPRGLNPERVSQGGGGGRSSGLLLVFYPLALLPVALAFLARYAFESQVAFVVVLALAAAIGGVVYWIGLESAVKTATSKREEILQELSRSEGPVAQE